MGKDVRKTVTGWGGSGVTISEAGIYARVSVKVRRYDGPLIISSDINRSSAIALRDALTRIIARMPRRKGAK